MTQGLYPLKFTPLFKDKVWGGRRMPALLNKDYKPLSKCGESWEISGLPGNESVVSNGFLAGNALPELIEVYMGDLVGDKVFAHYGRDFPLLFKFLDTDGDLSIQVHPDDSLALERHQSRGKTECWYVLGAEPGAELIVGFNRDITPGIYRDHLEKRRLREILRSEQVKAGDLFFIPAGQVHAIGRGITLCEIQQASDITYRIYDWDRPGEDGRPRKLHTEEAMDAIHFASHDSRVPYQDAPNKPVALIECPFFTIRKLSFDREMEMDYLFVDSFVVYTCLEGGCTLYHGAGSEGMGKGDTLLIPAEINGVRLKPAGHCVLLESYIA